MCKAQLCRLLFTLFIYLHFPRNKSLSLRNNLSNLQNNWFAGKWANVLVFSFFFFWKLLILIIVELFFFYFLDGFLLASIVIIFSLNIIYLKGFNIFTFCRFSRYNKESSLCRLEKARRNLPESPTVHCPSLDRFGHNRGLSMLEMQCVLFDQL